MEVSGKPLLLIVLLFGLVSLLFPDNTSGPAEKEEVFHFPTANPGTSVEAKRLLLLLYELKGNYTLSGQHNFLEDPGAFTGRVKQLTGDYPALIGFELGVVLDHTREEVEIFRQNVVNEAIAAHKAGSLVTITYHAAMPGQCLCWEHVNNGGISKQQFEEIVTPGTEHNRQWIADIDEVAAYLKQLRDAKVPVLWRPYHEMNGGWFWWGKQPKFAALWEAMFDRYTNVHKLDNLLWVWSPSAPSHYADTFETYYVGHLRADVLAVDIYDNDYQQSHHDRLWVLAAGKPIAIGENGELPAPDLLNEGQSQYVWFMGWADELEKKNSHRDIAALYRHDRVLNRSRLAGYDE